MDARELTREYGELVRRIDELEKKVGYLETLTEKQELKINDMQIDLKMSRR